MSRSSVPRRRRRVAAAGVLTVLSVVVITSRALLPARASVSSPDFAGYSAIADAEGISSVVEAKGYLVTGDDVLDVSAPTASTSVDGLGNSQGYAALPYPGSTVVAAPGLASGKSPVPVPPYPLIAQSSYPANSHTTASYGSATLDSQSQADTTTAAANTGPSTSAGQEQATATSKFDPTSGEVSADGEAVVSGVDLGSFKLTEAQSSAEISQFPGEPASKGSSFSATFISASNETVSVSDGKLVVGGIATPMPSNQNLSDLIGASGFTVQYLQPESSPGGVVSAGLQISRTVSIPNSPNPGLVTYTMGRASAAVAPALSQPNPLSTLLPQEPSDSSLATPLPNTSAAPTAVATPAQFVQQSHPVSALPTAPLSKSATTAPRHYAALAAAPLSLSFYIVLCVAAGIAFGAAQLIRLLAVRHP